MIGDPARFINELGEQLKAIARETGVERMAEPRRLFEAREYRASVISSMTLLETTLRERLNKSFWQDVRRPLSMRSLIDRAVEQNVIQAQYRARIESWMRVRNEVVHSSVQIGKEKAREIVEGVFEVLGMG